MAQQVVVEDVEEDDELEEYNGVEDEEEMLKKIF